MNTLSPSLMPTLFKEIDKQYDLKHPKKVEPKFEIDSEMFAMLKNYSRNRSIKINPKSIASIMKPKREKHKRSEVEGEWDVLERTSARINS